MQSHKKINGGKNNCHIQYHRLNTIYRKKWHHIWWYQWNRRKTFQWFESSNDSIVTKGDQWIKQMNGKKQSLAAKRIELNSGKHEPATRERDKHMSNISVRYTYTYNVPQRDVVFHPLIPLKMILFNVSKRHWELYIVSRIANSGSFWHIYVSKILKVFSVKPI